jgi:hypothetical protein
MENEKEIPSGLTTQVSIWANQRRLTINNLPIGRSLTYHLRRILWPSKTRADRICLTSGARFYVQVSM